MEWKYIKKLKDINCITKIENEYNIHIPQTLIIMVEDHLMKCYLIQKK